MATTTHVYQIFIAARPEQVWLALTDSDWTRRWFHGTSFVEPPAGGRAYRTVTEDGAGAVDGVIEVFDPPQGDRPGMLVQTWHVLYDAALAEEPPSRVEWTVASAGDGLTRVRLVHGDLAFSPLTWESVKDGWAWLLDSLKTLLETGRGLGRWSRRDHVSASSTQVEGDWHRRQGVQANNATWDLLGQVGRTADDDEDLLRGAYAAAYHWHRASGATPANAVRADYLIGKSLLATGSTDAALRMAERCLAGCVEQGLADFDLAYAHELRARSLLALGRTAEAEGAWRDAIAVPIDDPEDRAIVDADFADYPAAAISSASLRRSDSAARAASTS